MTDKAFNAYRLKEERQRLGLKQEEISEKSGIRRDMWSKYETGKMVPGGDILALMASAGIDINYVLTGERNPAFSITLSVQEERLIYNYRSADEEGKRAAHRVLDALAKSTPDGKKSA